MDQAHYDKIIKGVPTWNAWRADNPEIIPDLMGVYLLKTNLTEANFQGTNLTGANFQKSILFGANFEKAKLMGSNFMGAQLGGEPSPKKWTYG